MTGCVPDTAGRQQGGAARPTVAAMLAIASLVGAVGCSGPARRAITGSVSLEGQPLDEAVIMFVPLDAFGRKTGATIAGGVYEVPRDVGLIPGRYRVEIADDSPFDKAHQPRQTPSQPQSRRPLPIVYASVNSPLSIEVATHGETVFDFALMIQSPGTP